MLVTFVIFIIFIIKYKYKYGNCIHRKRITFELKHNQGRNKFCSQKCLTDYINTQITVQCANCGKEVKVQKNVYEKSLTKNFFCSHSCSASYNNTVRKLSKKVSDEKVKNRTKHISTTRKIRICKLCGNEYYRSESGSTRCFCSKECSEEFRKNRKKYLSEETLFKLSQSGRKSVEIQSENRRSKNEKYFCELCEQYFKDVKHNESIFNGWDADVIIHDIKYAILWNGKWHYSEISKKTTLKQIQNRDNIKIKEIVKKGYIPYIVKDMGKYNPSFVEDEFNKFLEHIK